MAEDKLPLAFFMEDPQTGMSSQMTITLGCSALCWVVNIKRHPKIKMKGSELYLGLEV